MLITDQSTLMNAWKVGAIFPSDVCAPEIHQYADEVNQE